MSLMLFALTAALAPAVADPCNPAIPYTLPDHDQSRSTAPGVVGLQNNGSQYCVPTCTMNILTYLQNHGYPALDAGPGPGPWLGSQPIYNSFSTDIESLAGLMNTDPLGGTGGTNALAGVRDWIDNAGLTGDVVVTSMGMNISSAPELGDIAFSLLARCPISISVGWYQPVTQLTMRRAGGHCVTVSRLPDFCTNSKKISIRDPGNSVGSNSTSQGAGTTETYNTITQNVIRVDPVNTNSVIYSGPLERIMGYASSPTMPFIDGFRSYLPAFGLSACNNPVNGSCVQQFIPKPTFTALPRSTHIDLPGGASVLDLDIAADNLSTWMLVRLADGDLAFFRNRFGASLPEARSFPSMQPFNPRRICSGRDQRTLFILDNNPHLIVRLNTATGAATPISVADPISAICFDHARNELVAFSSSARRVTRINPATGAPGTGKTLAAEVVVGVQPRISICPVGAYLWLTSGETIGYGLVEAASNTLAVAATISSSQPLLGVDNNDKGHVFTSSGGQVIEFEAPHATTVLAWARVDGVSPFAPLGDGPLFRIARSRSNLERAIHDQPSETLDVMPTVFTNSVADCRADINNSGGLSVQDVFDFLSLYFSDSIFADFNENGSVTVQDLFDFLGAYFAGCVGS